MIDEQRDEILYYQNLFRTQIGSAVSDAEKLDIIENLRKRYSEFPDAMRVLTEVLKENRQKMSKEDLELANNTSHPFVSTECRKLYYSAQMQLELIREYFFKERTELLVNTLDGLLCDRRRTSVIRFLENNKSNAKLIALLGVCNEYGVGMTQNFKIAFECYNQAIKLCSEASQPPNPIALTFLGNFYQKGIMVEKDIKKSIEFYQQALRQNFFPAGLRLAILYTDNNQNEEAVKLYEALAKQGIVLAMYRWWYNLGLFNDEGGVEELSRIRTFLKQAGDNGNDMAKLIFEQGQSDPNFSEILTLRLKIASQNAEVCAQLAYDTCTSFHNPIVPPNFYPPRDLNIGLSLLVRAATQGEPTLHYIPLDYKKEFEEEAIQKMIVEFQAGANNRDPIACYNLAYCYERGIGVLKRLGPETMALYHYAANEGHPVAQFRLGEIYETGTLYPRNLLLAHFWYQKALLNPLRENGATISSEYLSDPDLVERLEHINFLRNNSINEITTYLENINLEAARPIGRIIAEYAFNGEAYMRTEELRTFFQRHNYHRLEPYPFPKSRQFCRLIAEYAESNAEDVEVTTTTTLVAVPATASQFAATASTAIAAAAAAVYAAYFSAEAAPVVRFSATGHPSSAAASTATTTVTSTAATTVASNRSPK